MRPDAGALPMHEFADHVSEVLVRVRAGSLAELLAEAGRALAELQRRDGVPSAQVSWRDIEVAAGDPGALLVDWLNELIFLAETERWLATDFDVTVVADGGVRARAKGVHLSRAPGLVKAATLHGVRVQPVAGGVEGEVVLDV